MAGVFIMVNGNDTTAGSVLGPELLGRLLDRHAAALELYARQLCDYPDDVVQEALIELAGQRVCPTTPWRGFIAWRRDCRAGCRRSREPTSNAIPNHCGQAPFSTAASLLRMSGRQTDRRPNLTHSLPQGFVEKNRRSDGDV